MRRQAEPAQHGVDDAENRIEQPKKDHRRGHVGDQERQDHQRARPQRAGQAVEQDRDADADDHLNRHVDDDILRGDAHRVPEQVVAEQAPIIAQADPARLAQQVPVGEADDDRADRRVDVEHQEADQRRRDEQPPRDVLAHGLGGHSPPAASRGKRHPRFGGHAHERRLSLRAKPALVARLLTRVTKRRIALSGGCQRQARRSRHVEESHQSRRRGARGRFARHRVDDPQRLHRRDVQRRDAQARAARGGGARLSAERRGPHPRQRRVEDPGPCRLPFRAAAL